MVSSKLYPALRLLLTWKTHHCKVVDARRKGKNASRLLRSPYDRTIDLKVINSNHIFYYCIRDWDRLKTVLSFQLKEEVTTIGTTQLLAF